MHLSYIDFFLSSFILQLTVSNKSQLLEVEKLKNCLHPHGTSQVGQRDMWASLRCRMRRVKTDVHRTVWWHWRGRGTPQRGRNLSQIQKQDQTDSVMHQSVWGWVVTGGSKMQSRRQRRAFQGERSLQDGMEVWVSERTWPSLGNCKLFCILLHGTQMEAYWEMRLGELVATGWWGGGYRIVSRTVTQSDSRSTSGIVKCEAWSGGVRGSTQWDQRKGSSCNYQRKWFRSLKM